jgi:limonene-1,2-epoxide hydrolase
MVVMNERLDRVTFGGQLAELRSCGVFEIEDGRIKAWRDYFDTGALGRNPSA